MESGSGNIEGNLRRQWTAFVNEFLMMEVKNEGSQKSNT